MLQIKIIYVQKRDCKNDIIVNFINFLFCYDDDKCIFNVLVFLKKYIFFSFLIFDILSFYLVYLSLFFCNIFLNFFLYTFFEKKILCFILYTLKRNKKLYISFEME
jgi:hypothetical protein